MRNILNLLARLLAISSFSISVIALPSPGSVNSGLQILLHNDVYGNTSTRDAAVIVLDAPKTASDAAKACAALSETLWTPPDLTDDVFLPYLAYQSQPDWHHGHRARDVHGHGGPTHDPPHGPPNGPPHGPPGGPQPGFEELYHIAGNGPRGTCKAITPYGQTTYVSCSRPLPALCSQSAPLSGMYFEPNSTTYQTQVSSGAAVYTGFRDKLSFRFLGIRFAANPERFTYSSLYQAKGVQSALQFGDYCAQAGGGSDDCLFLNVWTPYLPSSSQKGSALKPVMMWIHGGAYINGMGSDPTFDGGNLASRGDVVVVTINYRLGALGFLTLNAPGIDGNYGISDQVTALKWIQANIESFGGDPARVTILGQSAGAGSVRALLQAPPATGLFSQAILQSNPQGPLGLGPSYTTYYNFAQEITAQTNSILNETGCVSSSAVAELACLRAYDPNALVTLPTLANNVVVDGTYVITDRLEWNHTGHVNSGPLMIGNMRDDGAPFISYIDTTSFETSLTDNGFPATEVINSGAFPVPAGANATLDVYNATARVSTDGQIRCGAHSTAYAAALTHTLPVVYAYEFNRSYQITYWDPNSPVCDAPITPEHPYGDTNGEYFKCHSGELMYVFGTWMRWGLPIRDEQDVPFTQFTIDTWASFVRTSNPVPDALFLEARGFTNTTLEQRLSHSAWKPVGAGAGQQTYRQLQWPSFQSTFKEAAQCDALEFPLNYFVAAS